MASNRRLLVLKKRSDFLNLAAKGRRIRMGGWLLFNYRSNELGQTRCGWTLPRNVGTAVVRNRLKRWSRVFFRSKLVEIHKIGVDLNVVFLKTGGDFYKKLDYDEFSKQMGQAWDLLRSRV